MVFPIIQTAILDYAFLTPVVCLISQLIKRLTYLKFPCVPSVLLHAGLTLSYSLTYRHSLFSGALMGLCYGLAAIGPYSTTKENLLVIRSFF